MKIQKLIVAKVAKANTEIRARHPPNRFPLLIAIEAGELIAYLCDEILVRAPHSIVANS